MTSAQIRQAFIDFFVKKHAHTFVPSSPVVPHDDPTLLFTNAGMNQFKPIFLGLEKRSYTRAVNTQKCIRAGGKHNDLDDVGRSRRHHTFFEMLGNWSFGDYFKKGAIEMAWELLTKEWKLDPTRIHVTCYEGDEANGVPRDTEAADIWRDVIGLPADHIHWGGKDNFWEMGETGPCGPCTEIFYDRTPDKTGGATVLSGEDPRVMEIWNNVFIQYNRNPDRTLVKLPARHVDTGMGFERICQVLQNKTDNYAIDLFEPIFAKISELSGQTYGGAFPVADTGDRSGESPALKRDIAFRVIADHARMATFAITDGAKPDNKGRDSVVRSVIRRAVRFGYQQFGLRKPFLYELVYVVADSMGDAFPELRKDPKRVAEIIETEEKSFLETIERGLALFEQAAKAGKQISGKDAFELHTTYGFPIDLTTVMATERGLGVDVADYEKRFADFRAESGKARKQHKNVAVDLGRFAETDDAPKYDGLTTTARVLGWIVGDTPVTNGTLDRSAGATSSPPADEELVALILDRTSFYAEQGGQIGDVGKIITPTGTFLVASAERRGKHVLHYGQLENGSIEVGQVAEVIVDKRRADIMRNHTATHLLNHALRGILGEHVEQRGSLVDADKLRFDFVHDKPITPAEIERIEQAVNVQITLNLKVTATLMPLAQAKQIGGVRAVFGEKYPDPVRVISIGTEGPAFEGAADRSVEFCGGTHLSATGEAGLFKIVEESSVSKGIRRIVAVTGQAAVRHVEQIESQLKAIATQLGTTPAEAPRRIAALQEEIRQLKKKLASGGGAGLSEPAKAAEKLIDEAPAIGETKLVVARFDGAQPDYLLAVMDAVKSRSPSYALLLAAVEEEKIAFLAAASDDVIKKGLKAGDWIRDIAKTTGGGGGGRPNMAQAGGKNVAVLDEALAAAKTSAAAKLE